MFAVNCRDKPSMQEMRADNRPAHLDYVKGGGSKIIAAGPLLDADHHAIGGLFLIDVPDFAAAREWAANDPFQALGIYESVEVLEWKYVFGTGIDGKI